MALMVDLRIDIRTKKMLNETLSLKPYLIFDYITWSHIENLASIRTCHVTSEVTTSTIICEFIHLYFIGANVSTGDVDCQRGWNGKQWSLKQPNTRVIRVIQNW